MGGIALVVKEIGEPARDPTAFLAIRQAEYSVPGCRPLTDALTSVGSSGWVSCASGVLRAPAPLQLAPGAYSKYQADGDRSVVSLPSSVTVSAAMWVAGRVEGERGAIGPVVNVTAEPSVSPEVSVAIRQ